MKPIQANIKKAKKYLDSNECIAVPTETVYGLAGNAYSDFSVKKIFKLKKRPSNNPLIVHYYNLKALEHDCIINEDFKKLYNKFSPGPITYVLKFNSFFLAAIDNPIPSDKPIPNEPLEKSIPSSGFNTGCPSKLELSFSKVFNSSFFI